MKKEKTNQHEEKIIVSNIKTLQSNIVKLDKKIKTLQEDNKQLNIKNKTHEVILYALIIGYIISGIKIFI